MSKHTPGPWKLIDRGESFELARYWIGAGETDWRGPSEICSVLTNKDTKANARLIAAAPEMLEALKAALGMSSPIDRYENAKLFELIEAAIAKAEGK